MVCLWYIHELLIVYPQNDAKGGPKWVEVVFFSAFVFVICLKFQIIPIDRYLCHLLKYLIIQNHH